MKAHVQMYAKYQCTLMNNKNNKTMCAYLACVCVYTYIIFSFFFSKIPFAILHIGNGNDNSLTAIFMLLCGYCCNSTTYIHHEHTSACFYKTKDIIFFFAFTKIAVVVIAIAIFHHTNIKMSADSRLEK